MFSRSLPTIDLDLSLKSQRLINSGLVLFKTVLFESILVYETKIILLRLARNRDNFTIKSNIWDQKVNHIV